VKQKLVLPPPEPILTAFAERHELKLTDILRREAAPICAAARSNILINDGFSRLNDAALSDPTMGLLLNMLHRTFEHADAAIVSFVSGCGSSAEVVSRAAIESSVNIIYILAGDRKPRLMAYFEAYLDGVDDQVKKWRAQVRDSAPEIAKIHHTAADQRLAANDAMRTLIHGLEMAGPKERWPRTIADRFSAIGEGETYRTVYARLGSETHADAEETLRFFVGRATGNKALLQRMALEGASMQRFYIHHAALFLLRASLAYSQSFAMDDATTL
jgi:hypothetical protein